MPHSKLRIFVVVVQQITKFSSNCTVAAHSIHTQDPEKQIETYIVKHNVLEINWQQALAFKVSQRCKHTHTHTCIRMHTRTYTIITNKLNSWNLDFIVMWKSEQADGLWFSPSKIYSNANFEIVNDKKFLRERTSHEMKPRSAKYFGGKF